MSTTLNDNGAEITVSDVDAAGMGSYGQVDMGYLDTLKQIGGVEDTSGLLAITVQDDSLESELGPEGSGGGMMGGGLSVYGVDPDKLALSGVTNIVDGSVFTNNSTDALIGKSLADTMNMTIGDTFTIRDEEYTITGVYETGNMMTDNNIYVALDKLQNITDSDYYSMILVKTAPDTNDTQLGEQIDDAYPDLSTTTSEDTQQMMSDALGIIDTVTLAISLLAILVGGIGIINTMVMTVYERTKEIGVLKAVGWTNRRVLVMIIGESVVLTIISGIIGSIVGIVLAEGAVTLMASGDNGFSLVFEPSTFIMAFGIAIIVGIIGGLYPAYMASRLAPTEALRYE